MGMERLLLLAAFLPGLALAAMDPSPVAPGIDAPAPAEADTILGTVREASGAPVPTARIEVRAQGRLLASSRSDEAGAFRLVLRQATTGPYTLRVDRFGYHGHERTLEGVPAVELLVVLDPAPLPLPGFQVEATRDACSAGEDPQARRLWQAAVRRHPGGLDTLGVATYLHGWSDTLPMPARGYEEGRVGSPGQRGSAPLLRLSWERRVQRDGYAFQVRRTDSARSFDSWSYAPLEADFAPHFVHETFGRLNRFLLEGDEEGEYGWILRFCSRNQDRPYLEGSLELTPDTLLHRAEWRFGTPEPDEDAGGWARFPAATPQDPTPFPLPVESMTWRRLPDGEMLRKAQSYEGWILAPGDSVPFLRSRAPDSLVTPGSR